LNARGWGLVAACGSLVADQGSKLLLLYGFGFAAMAPNARAFSSPVLDLVMAWNPGISFSFLAAHSTAGIAALALAAAAGIAALGIWLWQATRVRVSVGLGLIIGGAIGNLLDRLTYGRVADFFDVHLARRNFFACNVADILISLGVVLLLVDSLFFESAPAKGPR